MTAAEGPDVVRIVDKHGAPVRRTWRAVVQLAPRVPVDDSALAPVHLVGVALVRAEHATEACQIIRRTYPRCDIFGVEEA